MLQLYPILLVNDVVRRRRDLGVEAIEECLSPVRGPELPGQGRLEKTVQFQEHSTRSF